VRLNCRLRNLVRMPITLINAPVEKWVRRREHGCVGRRPLSLCKGLEFAPKPVDMDAVPAILGFIVGIDRHSQRLHDRLERAFRGHAIELVGVWPALFGVEQLRVAPVSLRRIFKVQTHPCTSKTTSNKTRITEPTPSCPHQSTQGTAPSAHRAPDPAAPHSPPRQRNNQRRILSRHGCRRSVASVLRLPCPGAQDRHQGRRVVEVSTGFWP